MKSSILIIFVLLVSLTHSNAQEFITLYPTTAELTLPKSETKDDVTRITDVIDPRLFIYEPKSSKWNGDHIIICPGGGYQILAIDKEGTEIAEWFTNLGYKAYVLEYTVPQNRAQAQEDLITAINFVTNQDDFTSDSKLGIMGFSAGGHLAATTSSKLAMEAPKENSSTRAPDYTILLYPAYLDKGENGSLSEEMFLGTENTPFFVFVTADDPYAPSALTLVNALQKNETSVEFHMLPVGGHGYGMRKGSEAGETWPILLEKWLKNR